MLEMQPSILVIKQILRLAKIREPDEMSLYARLVGNRQTCIQTKNSEENPRFKLRESTLKYTQGPISDMFSFSGWLL